MISPGVERDDLGRLPGFPASARRQPNDYWLN